MEPVSSIMSAILKVLREIAKAERAARRNRARCRDIARRTQVVSSVLHDAREGDATATKRMILCRLREALDDALRLVESCADRDGRLSSRLSGLLKSRARAARFDDVDKRINNCLVELNAASGSSIEKKIDRLVESSADHDGRSGWLSSWLSGFRGSLAWAARFVDPDKRINNCLAELDGLTVAAHDHPCTNRPCWMQKENKDGNAPQKCATDSAMVQLPPWLGRAGAPYCPEGYCYGVVCIEERPGPCSVM